MLVCPWLSTVRFLATLALITQTRPPQMRLGALPAQLRRPANRRVCPTAVLSLFALLVTSASLELGLAIQAGSRTLDQLRLCQAHALSVTTAQRVLKILLLVLKAHSPTKSVPPTSTSVSIAHQVMSAQAQAIVPQLTSALLAPMVEAVPSMEVKMLALVVP